MKAFDLQTTLQIPVSEHPGDSESEVRDIDTSVYAQTSNPKGFARIKENVDVTLPLNNNS